MDWGWRRRHVTTDTLKRTLSSTTFREQVGKRPKGYNSDKLSKGLAEGRLSQISLIGELSNLAEVKKALNW